ncbi:hypothetical protein XBJ2_1560039 [Xenorhabdus bovienii str. Jollieti]|uniref:Uncharacterized protein n=1 Tax=Xenorhabdus bovienii (strain SS-2004) TaxID=406818 RepID=D3V8A9_XENBS|nr:hypothetical protein [Xenorhabdus bovienii]CBJ82071.1 hypothetical protein XBJ1_2947 [Xenorhabdus bovienii SS-2004]CDH27896.1 hypothetical protein XBJ2_1560039 [Xenorhabdus bovienii str. Jollieti]
MLKEDGYCRLFHLVEKNIPLGAAALAIMIVLFGNIVLMLNQTHSIHT